MNRLFAPSILLTASLIIALTSWPPAYAQVGDLESLGTARQAPLESAPDPGNDPGLYFLMAEQAAADGDAKKMFSFYRKALSLDPTSAYLNIRIASLMARKRRLADAIIMARFSTIFDPRSDEAYSLMGKIFTVTGDRDRAIEAYYKALEIKPDDKELYIFTGSLQATQKLHAEAEKTFERMIRQFPDEKEGYFYLGKVYTETEQFDKAIETFRKLLSKDVDSASQVHSELGAVYHLQKNYQEAEKHFKEAIRFDPQNMNARLNLGQALAVQEKFEESYQVFEELSKLAPSNMSFRIRMALILAAQKQFDKARELLDKILQDKPGLDQVRFHLGRVLREQGKVEEAEKEFSEIRRGSPSFVNSRVALALMFLKRQEFAKTIRYIDEAIQTDLKDPDLHQIRGSVLEELHRYDEALKSYAKATELDPLNTRLQYSIGNAYEKSGRRTRGIEQMEKIIQENPDDASALNFIGYTLLMMDQDLERSGQLIRKALSLKPDDGYIIDSLGWLLLKTGDTDKSLENLKKAAEKVKSDPIVADHLGDAYLKKGMKSDAAQAYRRSLKANPDNLLVREKLRKLEEELGPQGN
jgi:tetratricopeptide (TPR) repeat protein